MLHIIIIYLIVKYWFLIQLYIFSSNLLKNYKNLFYSMCSVVSFDTMSYPYEL